jgi:hypothetical protein
MNQHQATSGAYGNDRASCLSERDRELCEVIVRVTVSLAIDDWIARARQPPTELRTLAVAFHSTADLLARRGELRHVVGALGVSVEVLGPMFEDLWLRSGSDV